MNPHPPYLHQPSDWVAAHPQVVLQRDLRCVLDLGRGSAQHRTEARSRHRSGRSNLSLINKVKEYRAFKTCTRWIAYR